MLLQRAEQATGFAAGAEGRTQIHHRLGVITHPFIGCVLLGAGPQLFLNGGGAGPAFHGVEAGEHAFYVAIQDRSAFAGGDGEYGTGGGAADTRQGFQLVHGLWKLAVVVSHHHLGSFVQVAGAGVVAEAGPEVQHLVLLGFSQRIYIRETVR